ncbi:hypothetical protein CsSME_00043037 [Camellia sinensis var. sinensis]
MENINNDNSVEEIKKDNSEEEIKKDRSFKFNTFLSKFLYRKRMKKIKKDRSLKDEIKEDGSLKPEIQHDHSLNLEHVKEEIEAIKTEMMGIYDMGLEATQQVGSFSSSGNSNPTRANTNPTAWCALEEEIMVGFEDEALTLKEQLTRGPKQLEVISIVGMAGQGKTTLATKLYNDPLIVYHFHVRAWTSVSQEYRKRDLLLRLVSCVMPHTNRIDQMSDEKLAEMLYKSLKGRTYFIVMDDIWDTRAWLDLKICFPNDNNGSRILFTSRHEDVALQAKPNNPPLSLRFLTHNESWDLFQHKVFGKRENCPPELVEIGKQITNKCQGLPLSIVVVAGIFINEEKSQDRWKQVGETLKSNLAANPQACMKTLALSYIHLPGHLKPCFLYFGAFPEDFQIPLWKLIWLWIAEGFIQKIGEKSLEDVAEEYLMDLIARSLVLVTRRAYDGGIKECSIHDLLRDFCLRKSEEEYFLQQISGINKIGMQYPHDQYPFLLDNLQTLSWVDPWSCRDLLFGTPNIRKLGFRGQLIDGGCHNCSSNSLKSIQFPPNLKKLTLKKTNLKWDAMSTLVKLLPNLEVLKLLLHACTGQHWETSDGEFPQLKLLKLESLEIMQWEVSSNHFPTLQRLQLVNCHGLENIPSEIGDIPTLQVIEVHQCNPCLANSAREIKEEQESMGNNWLQILIRTTNLEACCTFLKNVSDTSLTCLN